MFKVGCNSLYAGAKRHRNSFFPYCISQWNSLDSRSTNLPSNATFKRAVLDFMCPVYTNAQETGYRILSFLLR